MGFIKLFLVCLLIVYIGPKVSLTELAVLIVIELLILWILEKFFKWILGDS